MTNDLLGFIRLFIGGIFALVLLQIFFPDFAGALKGMAQWEELTKQSENSSKPESNTDSTESIDPEMAPMPETEKPSQESPMDLAVPVVRTDI